MDSVHVERWDHLGLMSSMINDVRRIDMVDTRLVPEEPEEITPGHAVAGMILKGWGLAHRPWSRTPQFLMHNPLELLCRGALRAELVNRLTLGRTLDAVQAYGGDLFLRELALAVWVQEGIDQRFHHRDTTSLARRGDDVPERDEQAISPTHGDAKDHRPDLHPAVWARLVSHDGGVPLVRTSGDGQASETPLFPARAAARLTACAQAPTPRDLLAEATLSHEATAPTLATLGVITRMPGPLTLVAPVLTPALTADLWQRLEETTRDHRLEWCHDGRAPRWLVVSSQAAMARAEASVTNAPPRAWDAIEQPRWHWQAQRLKTPQAAHAALATLATAWRSHQRETSPGIAHPHEACTGRPTSRRPLQAIAWQMHAHVPPDHERIACRQPQEACWVIGTNMDANPWRAPAVIHAYKAPAQVEGGWRFRKDPVFCVSALWVNQPCRMPGLLLGMT